MKLVANIKLVPTTEQAHTLRETLERCNAACTYLSERGFDAGKLRQYDLHKLAYRETRQRFNLTAQAVVRCIAKVADAYKTGKDGRRRFRRFAAQPYDSRIIRFMSDDKVNIWTLSGRQKIPFVCGPRQRTLLAYRKGEVDLMLVIGDKLSANTKRLVELCTATGTPTHQIQTAAELDQAWLKNKQKVGVTAGASTPEWVIAEVVKALPRVP